LGEEVGDVRIIVADDHPLYLEAIAMHLERLDAASEICRATSVDATLALLAEASADLVLLDFSMPGDAGGEGLKRVIVAAGKAPVVVMSGVALESDVLACINAGARGFLPKTLEGRLFTSAISHVISGGTYVPAELVVAIGRAGRSREDRPVSPPLELKAYGEFSERELALLRRVVAGEPNKVIAKAMDMREVTVKFYLTRIFKKLGVKNRSHAAVKAIRSGLVSGSGDLEAS
jgi:two-component system, NarL family, nitrate/nitrite response regulator NarL